MTLHRYTDDYNRVSLKVSYITVLLFQMRTQGAKAPFAYVS